LATDGKREDFSAGISGQWLNLKSRWGECPRKPLGKATPGSRGRSPHQIQPLPISVAPSAQPKLGLPSGFSAIRANS
jgi:hypothetical protein